MESQSTTLQFIKFTLILTLIVPNFSKISSVPLNSEWRSFIQLRNAVTHTNSQALPPVATEEQTDVVNAGEIQIIYKDAHSDPGNLDLFSKAFTKIENQISDKYKKRKIEIENTNNQIKVTASQKSSSQIDLTKLLTFDRKPTSQVISGNLRKGETETKNQSNPSSEEEKVITLTSDQLFKDTIANKINSESRLKILTPLILLQTKELLLSSRGKKLVQTVSNCTQINEARVKDIITSQFGRILERHDSELMSKQQSRSM